MRLSCACAFLFLLVLVSAASPAAAFSSFPSSFAAPTYRIHTSSGGVCVPLLHSTVSDVQDKAVAETGTVAWFNAFRGFGFISKDDGSGDVYVHHSNIVMDGFRKLEEGERVGFKVGKDTSERGKGKLYAYDVTEIGSAPDNDLTEKADAKEEEVADEVATVSVRRAEKDSEVDAEAEASDETEKLEAEKTAAATDVAAVTKPDAAPAPKSGPRKDYRGVDLEEQAFNILLDLGAVSLTPDPDSPDYDSSMDDDLAPENVNIG